MQNIVPTTIRIYEETKTAIEDIALNENRSFNKQVEYILQKYIAEYLEKNKSEKIKR